MGLRALSPLLPVVAFAVAALAASGTALGQPASGAPSAGSATVAPRPGPPPVAELPRGGLPSPGNLDLSLPGIDPRQCGPSPHAALCAKGRWTHFSNLDVRVQAPGFDASYVMEIAQNNEVHATYRETARGKTRGGEIVLVGSEGFAFRTREKFPPDAPVVDIMTSAPIITAELVAFLLDQGVIGPPADVTAPRTIEAGSATQFIRASAPNAATLYGPPWRMTGSVRPGTRPGDVAFSVRLAYRPVDSKGKLLAGRTDTLKLDGKVSFTPRRGTLPDTLDLTGFTLMHGDQPLPPQGTVGEARKAMGS